VKADNREMEVDAHVAKDNYDAELEVALQRRRARAISKYWNASDMQFISMVRLQHCDDQASGTGGRLRAERSADNRQKRRAMRSRCNRPSITISPLMF
jgi:hypothetical protein